MGVGLFYDSEGKTVYFEPFEDIPFDGDEDENHLLRTQAWDDSLFEIRENLPEGFSFHENGKWDRAGRVIATSDLHQICILEDEGGYGYVFLTVKPVEIDLYDEEQEARYDRARDELDSVASGFFETLHREEVLGELRIRDTAWTSKPYEPAPAVSMSP